MTAYPHLIPEIASVMDNTDKERIHAMGEQRWIGYPLAKEIINNLESLLVEPEKPRMPNLLITGESNNGKTTIIEHFVKQKGSVTVDEEGKTVRPIILAQSPPVANEKRLLISILQHFLTPYRESNTAGKLTELLIHLMKECQVKMLIVDEIHSMLVGSSREQTMIMSVLKGLSNELRIPIVGVGTEKAVLMLHTDPQHASRFDVISLPTWNMDKGFQSLIASFEKLLPLKQPSNLHKAESVKLIHAISGGNLGNVHRLLRECAKEAIISGKEQIDKEIIQSKHWVRPTKGVRSLFR